MTLQLNQPKDFLRFVDGEKVSSDLPRDPRARQAPLVGAACAARTGAPSA